MGLSKNSRNNFLVQGSILAVASIIVRIIGILYRIPMVNTFGEEGNGYYGYAFNIYNIALILSSYSMPLAVSKLVAMKSVKKEYRNSHRIFKAAMILSASVGFLASVVVFFSADFIAVNIYKEARIAYPLKVLAPTLFVFSIMGVLRGFYQGKNTMLPTAVSQVLEQIINAVVSVLAAEAFMRAHSASSDIAGYGAAGGTFGTITGALFALLFLLFVYFLYRPTIMRQIRRDRYSEEDSYIDIYKLLTITIVPVILSQTVYQISGMLDDIMFAQIMEGKGVSRTSRSIMVGIFGKYRLLTNVPIAISSAIAASMIPSIVASKTIGAHSEVNDKIKAAIKFNMILAFPCAVGLSVLAVPIMDFLFPGSSQEAKIILMIGGVAIVFYALSTVSNAILQGVNYMRVPVTNAAISLGIHIGLVFGLLKFTDMGIYALVIGNITFPLVICILNWVAISRYLTYKQEIMKTFIIPFISSIIMGIFAFLSYKGVYQLISVNAIATIVAVMVSIIIYFLFIILLRGLSIEELYSIPKGRIIVKIATKLHLI